MTVTDFATCFISLFFIYRGYTRGFLHSILIPFSILAATILSGVYYQMTNNMIVSLIIGLIGPFVLCFLLKFILKLWVRALNNDIQQPGFISRLAGGALTLIWGWVFIVLFLILLVVLPTLWGNLMAVHNDVIKSASYQIVAKPIKEAFFNGPPQNTVVPSDNSTIRDDARSLADDPRFQAITQDPEIQKDIDAHDFAKLMSNPKMMHLVQQVMSDPATMKKVFAIYKSQTLNHSPLPDQSPKNQ